MADFQALWMGVELTFKLVLSSWVSFDLAAVGSLDIVIVNFGFGSENLKTQRIYFIFFFVVEKFEVLHEEWIFLGLQLHFETFLPIS